MIHPFLVHFSITISLLALIRWAGIPLLEWIPTGTLKWGVPGLLAGTLLSGQYSFGSLHGLSHGHRDLLEWHRGLAIGTAALVIVILMKPPARPFREESLKDVLQKNGKALLGLPALAILLILVTASIGGILVHSLRVGVPPQM